MFGVVYTNLQNRGILPICGRGGIHVFANLQICFWKIHHHFICKAKQANRGPQGPTLPDQHLPCCCPLWGPWFASPAVLASEPCTKFACPASWGSHLGGVVCTDGRESTLQCEVKPEEAKYTSSSEERRTQKKGPILCVLTVTPNHPPSGTKSTATSLYTASSSEKTAEALGELNTRKVVVKNKWRNSIQAIDLTRFLNRLPSGLKVLHECCGLCMFLCPVQKWYSGILSIVAGFVVLLMLVVGGYSFAIIYNSSQSVISTIRNSTGEVALSPLEKEESVEMVFPPTVSGHIT